MFDHWANPQLARTATKAFIAFLCLIIVVDASIFIWSNVAHVNFSYDVALDATKEGSYAILTATVTDAGVPVEGVACSFYNCTVLGSEGPMTFIETQPTDASGKATVVWNTPTNGDWYFIVGVIV